MEAQQLHRWRQQLAGYQHVEERLGEASRLLDAVRAFGGDTATLEKLLGACLCEVGQCLKLTTDAVSASF